MACQRKPGAVPSSRRGYADPTKNRPAALSRWGFVLLATISLWTVPAHASDLEEPCSGPEDWIQLTSSEWLKGDLLRMRSLSVEFKSKEMKTVRLKWSKVAKLCIGSDARFVRQDQSVLRGRGTVGRHEVSVWTEAGETRFERADLLAILPGVRGELDKWSLAATVGIDSNVGNTNQTSINATLTAGREDRRSRFASRYSGSFGVADGNTNVNRHRLDNFFDWSFGRYLYWAVLDMPVVYDEFQNLDVRVTPSTGPGWQIYDRSYFGWNVEAGVGYQYTKFGSVTPPQQPTANDAALRLSTNLKWDITSGFDFNLTHDTVIVPTDIGLTSMYTRASIKYKFADLLTLETTGVHNRIFDPVPTASNNLPSPDDFQLIVSIGLEWH